MNENENYSSELMKDTDFETKELDLRQTDEYGQGYVVTRDR